MSSSPGDFTGDGASTSDPASWREQKLFREGPVTVFRWVAAESWPVEYVSPNVRQFGYTADDFTSGRVPYAKIVHPEDLARIAAEVTAHTVAGVASFEQDYRIVRPDGEVRDVFDRTVVVRDAAGKLTHYDGYIIDVTERRRAQEAQRNLEQQIQHTQRIESLGLLAGGVAHEFNNLLHAVLGNAGLVLGQLRGDDDARPAIEAIEAAAKRATELTGELLACSGRGRFHVESIDLSRLVAEMVHLLQAVGAKKTTIEVELAEKLPRIEGDVTQLRQIVMNLVTNASEALGDTAGVVRVRTRAGGSLPAGAENPVPLERGPGDSCVVLEVRDDGHGMDAATRKRIFDPFFTTKQTGRGLGLAATLGIVRGHGAAIYVASAEGKGTTIHLRFPLAKPAPATVDDAPRSPVAPRGPLPGIAPDATSRRNGLVLIVEDDPQVRDVARRMLKRLGHDALVASCAREAIEFHRDAKEPVIAAIVDLTLPDESGDAVIAKLRAVQPDLPVLLSSGYDENDVRLRIDAAQQVVFLRKPYSLARLDAALRGILGPRGN